MRKLTPSGDEGLVAAVTSPVVVEILDTVDSTKLTIWLPTPSTGS
jgi:hypothetical protein